MLREQEERKVEMSIICIGTWEAMVLTVLLDLNNGKVDDAVAPFAEEFCFKDHGLGLEFKDKKQLTEFFNKTRELYPDATWETDKVFLSDENVIVTWTLRFTLLEPFYGSLSRKLQVAVEGISIARIADDKIDEWTDYYDGLSSRRTALASHFTEWVEL